MWIVILVLGVTFSSLGISPIEIIRFAQVANGIALPVIVGILLWIMNQQMVLGAYKNSLLHNMMGGLIFVVTIALGSRAIYQVWIALL